MGSVPQSTGDDLGPWLADALGTHGRLAGVQTTPIGQGEGFVGQLARVALTWDEAEPGAPTSVIVKMPTADPGGRAVGQMMGLYERESRFYAELADSIGVRVPHCHVNVADPAADEWALVLEDLTPMVPGDQVEGAGIEQANVVVDQLARLHGRFYGNPALDELTWIPTLAGDTTAMIVPMFEASWDAFVEHYGSRTPARVLDWIERFTPQVPGFIESYVDMPTTLCHGDFRLDNMFFANGTGDAAGAADYALIDWQMSMRVPGSSDLVYFLVTNLAPEVRREHQWELIRRYVDALHAEGVSDDLLSHDDVVRGYRQGVLLYGVMFVSTMTMERANARGEAFFDALVGRTVDAIDDLDSGTLLGL